MAYRFARLICVSAILTVPAAGQEVRGRALAPGAVAPMPGVIVTLIDSAGAVVDRTLTTNAGTFRLRTEKPATYRLRALRVGFQPTESPAFALARGQLLEQSIELTSSAVALSAQRVEAQRRCDMNPDSSSAAFGAWEEARKALDAALLTRDRRHILEIVRYDRSTSVRTGAVLTESEAEQRGTTSRPFVAVPLADLDTMGYVYDTREFTTFRAPDEKVLLSEQFAATHCFRLAQPKAPDEVSVAFEPVGNRKLADIVGTLVLDRKSAALRRLEFTYVNVPRDVEREEAGGRVFFRALPGGAWIVDRWTMRFPMFERVVKQLPNRGTDILRREEELKLYAMQESGGEVSEVSDGNTIVWQTERPHLVGSVRDGRGAPIPGATVTIQALGRRATTGADGRFDMRAVRRARRVVLVTAPILDSLGLAPIVRESDSRTTDDVTLTLPTREVLFATACPLELDEVEQGAYVRGVTRGPRGERIGGARVVASWYEPAAATVNSRALGATRSMETVSSAMGDYSLCGPRADQQVSLRLFVGGKPVGESKAVVPRDSRLLMLDVAARGDPGP
jgi:hypothetical protein